MAKKARPVLFLARIEHKYGDDTGLFPSEFWAIDFVFRYVSQNVDELPEALAAECKTLVKEKKVQDAIELYFTYMGEQGREFYGVTREQVARPPF